MGLEGRDYMREGRGTSLRGQWTVLAVSHKLILLNVLVFLCWQVRPLQPFLSDQFTVSWAGLAAGRVWTPLTAAFSHPGFVHLLWNMLFLHWLGPDLEQVYGRRNFLALYLASAAVASLAHVGHQRGWGHDVPAVGASGAVLGLMVVAALFFPQRRILLMLLIPVPLWALVVIKVGGDLVGVFGSQSGVSHAGHLGGAVAGFLFKVLDLRPFASPGQEGLFEEARARRPGLLAALRGLLRPPARPAAPPPPRVDPETEVRVDELLRKISREGMGSLTADELAFLHGASARYRGQP